MTSFYADPAALRRFGSRLGLLAEDVTVALDYAARWTDVPDSSDGVAFFNFRQRVLEVNDGVANSLRHAQTVLSASATEATATGAYYENTDAQEAASFDRTYPG